MYSERINMSKNKGKSKTHLTDQDVAIVAREPEFPFGHNVEPVEETVAVKDLTATTPETETPGRFVFGTADVPKRPGRKSALSYPIGVLEAGSKQYLDVQTTSDKAKKTAISIRQFAYRQGFSVTIANVDGAIRVWRKVPSPKKPGFSVTTVN